MAHGPKLELRQSQTQTLVMTAQLQQSIKLLQYSAAELNEFVAQEMEQNPFLARDEQGAESLSNTSEGDGDQLSFEGEEFAPDSASSGSSETMETWEASGSMQQQEMLDAPEEAFWDDAMGGAYEPASESFASFSGRSGGGGSGDSDYLAEVIEQTVSQEVSLRDHLREQLQVALSDAAQRIIGIHIIDLIDDRGYFTGDLGMLAIQLGGSVEEMEAVLKTIQTFDPPGVGARDLAECMAIQLAERDRLDPSMEKFLKHLDMLANGDISKLAWQCGVEEDDIPFMVAELRELNPKPGYQFGSETTEVVVPDVLLKRVAGGGWHVELNPDALPRVLVNQRYYAQIADKSRRKDDKKYITDQLAHANWLVKALDQRAQSILKVATEIVRRQDAFFRHGIRHLKPLTLKDVATELGIHESTVSRVTTSKYLSTGAALYELKYFFSSSLSSTSGDSEDALSSEAVKDMIREMVEKEDPKKILSDDTIAEHLQGKGVDIARRTVAKYREALGIPSSVERRREKNRGR